jgi:hypothetical protein
LRYFKVGFVIILCWVSCELYARGRSSTVEISAVWQVTKTRGQGVAAVTETFRGKLQFRPGRTASLVSQYGEAELTGFEMSQLGTRLDVLAINSDAVLRLLGIVRTYSPDAILTDDPIFFVRSAGDRPAYAAEALITAQDEENLRLRVELQISEAKS